MTYSENILSTLGSLPISGENPCGINIRYDDEFELIEDELSKQGALIDRGHVNWEKVTAAAINLLSNKSKDIKVSCYLIRALYEQNGFEGLSAGLKINQQLLENFWHEIFPTKNRARANAYEWLTSKFQPVLADIEPQLLSFEYLQQSFDAIKDIEFFLNNELSEHAPALGNFRRSIDELLQRLLQQRGELKRENDEKEKLEEQRRQAQKTEGNEQDQVLETNKVTNEASDRSDQKNFAETSKARLNSSSNSVSVSSNTNISTTISSDRDRNKVIRQCHEAMRNLSGYALYENLDSPSAYAMNRFSTWMAVNQLPDHTDGVTLLKPIPKDKINAYTSLFNHGNYNELIPQVEKSFSRAPFWIDAHRLTVQSLNALGMNKSAQQVKEHLALFIRRFPTIIELKFSDNSGFADQQTKQWIATEITQDSNSHNMNITDTDASSNYDEVISLANELAKKNSLKEAIQLFHNQFQAQANLKQQIYWKYHLARFCYDNGQQKLALSLLSEIDRFLQDNRLKYWEPELLKNVVYLLLLCMKQFGLKSVSNESADAITNDVGIDDAFVDSERALNKKDVNNKHIHNEINQLYTRLCQLDPVLAMDVSF